MPTSTNDPVVFISYSWSSPQHEQWVLELAERLVSDGVYVKLDKWDLKEGQDKYAFMEQMVTDDSVKKVLIISDKVYAEKANSRRGGVGTESQIISDDIYSKVSQEKFIPVVTEFDNKGQPWLPVYLRSRIYIHLSEPDYSHDEYEKLLRNIYEKPSYRRPPLGIPPSYISDEDKPIIQTRHHFSAVRDAIKNGKAMSKGALTDYLAKLINAFSDFYIQPIQGTPWDETVVKSIRDFKPYRDEFIELVDIICKYSIDNEYFEKLFEFFENSLQSNPTLMFADNIRFIRRELFLYLISILIRNKKYDETSLFLDGTYYYVADSKGSYFSYEIFDGYFRSIEEDRKRRLGLNRISVTADLIKDMADSQFVTFEELMQTDFILCIRGLLSDSARWFPRTLVYAERLEHSGFEIFSRAQHKRYFEVVKTLLKVNDKDDLITRFNVAYKKRNLNQWTFNGWPIRFQGYMNLDNLATI